MILLTVDGYIERMDSLSLRSTISLSRFCLFALSLSLSAAHANLCSHLMLTETTTTATAAATTTDYYSRRIKI